MSWCRNAEVFLIFVIMDLKVKGFFFREGSFLNPLRKGNYNNKGADVWE